MVMQYKHLADRGLVRVEMAKGLPFRENLYRHFFGEIRDTCIDEAGNWLWIECAAEEWRNYLVFVWGALGMSHLFEEQAEMRQMVLEFMQWKEQNGIKDSIAF